MTSVALLLALALAGCSSSEAPPEVQPGSARAAYGDYVLEHRRWTNAFVECLTEAGIPPVRNPDGSWQGFSVEGRPHEGGLDADCLSVAGPVPLNPPFDRGMLDDLYDAELASASCLREHGYPVAEPSSREAFVEGYESGAGPPWLAHQEVSTAVPLWEWQNEVLRDCPQVDPWSLFAPDGASPPPAGK